MEQSRDSTEKLASSVHTCKVRKPLHGLRQADERWGDLIRNKFIECGFQKSTQDQILYLYKKLIFISFILTVNYLAFYSNSQDSIDCFNDCLKPTYKVKLLGKLCFFIG